VYLKLKLCRLLYTKTASSSSSSSGGGGTAAVVVGIFLDF
jgi:hypothetical protein